MTNLPAPAVAVVEGATTPVAVGLTAVEVEFPAAVVVLFPAAVPLTGAAAADSTPDQQYLKKD